MMPDRRSILLVLATSLLLPGAAWTTSLAPLSLEQLTAAARVVARARCLGNYSRWENGEIWTFARFEVIETLKGGAPDRITVRLLGGRVGQVISTVDGVPRFHPGEEAILFLEPTRAGDLSLTGWAEGTFWVQRNPQTGAAQVTQAGARAVFDPATRRFRPLGIPQSGMPLELFRQQVRSAARRARSSRP